VRKIVYPLIWLAVTVTAVLVASAAVSSVRDQVTDTPTAMLPPTTMAISSTDQLIAESTQPEAATSALADESSVATTSAPTVTTTTLPETAATTTTTTIASSSDPEPAETTTTTTAPTATTTTTPPTEIRSHDLVGGSVSVEVGDGTVRLAGASPKPGFTMEVENSGPEKVEVEFHNDDHESHFTGKFEGGGFVASINESDESEDDD
jgi:hypothetical protein